MSERETVSETETEVGRNEKIKKDRVREIETFR